MDMMLVKSEMLNENRRRVLGVTAAASSEVKHIKRRRREPALPAVVTAGSKKDGTTEQTTGTTIKRSSKFRGVSRHRWTGRYEAHLWDKGSWNATQRKKGKQVYLGAYDVEESAARAYDLAALKYWGPTTFTNFPVADYDKEIEIMQTVTKEEYLASLRRKSSGFSRGVSKYRGVARHHHNGRWEARIGRVFGNKYLYLGTYSTQEEAAHAYDIAAIEYRGINAVTNFDLSTYIRWLRPGSTTNNININLQEQNKNGGLQFQTTLQPSSHFPTNLDTQVPLPTQRTFQLEELQVPCKQEFVSLQSQASKSSPTALSILLRSSVFQQLVEKNSNAEEEEENDNGLMYEGIEIEESDNAYYEKNDGGIWNDVMGIQ